MKKYRLTILLVSLLIASCSKNPKQESTTISNDSSTSFIDSESLIESESLSNSENIINEIIDIDNNVNLNAINKNVGLTPSIGNIDILLIPIHFKDITDNEMDLTLIDSAFNSEGNEKVEWLSVKEYYKQSSFGKCNLNFNITKTFTPLNDSSYYNDKYPATSYYYGAEEIINEALSFLDEKINFNDYDSNDDGYIDGIYLIYDHPVDYTYKDALWWAFTYYFNNESLLFDNKKIKSYVFAGYDFLSQDDALGNKNICNTHTYIHELSHMFGIDDYYDYITTTGTNIGGLAGADIMDETIGDHNSFTKALLNWNKGKYVKPEDSITIEIYPNEYIILANDFKDELGLLQEYFLLELYSPTGINEYDKMFNVAGIRVLHIVANTKKDGTLKYDNSYTNVKLISQITTSNGLTYLNSSVKRTDETLFTLNESLNEVKYANETKLNYSFTVDEVNNQKAIVTIRRLK